MMRYQSATKLKPRYSWLFGKSIFPLYERVLGRRTVQVLKELELAQEWDLERHSAYCMRRMSNFLNMAVNQVPYYSRIKAVNGSIDKSITAFPILAKEDIRKHFNDLINPVYRGKTALQATGGSTGVPTQFLVDKEREASTIAMRMRSHRWFHVNIGDREIVIWGAPIELGRQGIFRTMRDRVFRSHLISAFNFGDQEIRKALRKIREYKPRSLFGYSQCIFLVAEYCERSHEPKDCFPNLTTVFATAEPLYDFQRKKIEEVFAAKVAIEYGARDAGLIAHECPAGSLHINAEFIYVEIVDEYGNVLPPNQEGEIVVTNFATPSMPIIRLRTGDVGMLLDGACECGLPLPRMKLLGGRRSDFLEGNGGKRVHPLGAIYILREIPQIERFRVIQDLPNHLTVELRAREKLDSQTEQEIQERFCRLLDLSVEVEFSYKQDFPTTPSGKHRHVICKLRPSIS